MLVDKQIKEAIAKGEIVITPYDEKYVAPSAYEFHLGKNILVPRPGQTVDLAGDEDPVYDKFDISLKPYIIRPNEFILGQTLEVLTVAKNVGMFIDGRTTLGRLGLTVHVTATWIYPGHTDSIVTLEIKNVGNHNLILSEGIKIAKGIFVRSSESAEFAYNEIGRYPHQKEVMGANIV